jgi:hypothetical protein
MLSAEFELTIPALKRVCVFALDARPPGMSTLYLDTRIL